MYQLRNKDAPLCSFQLDLSSSSDYVELSVMRTYNQTLMTRLLHPGWGSRDLLAFLQARFCAISRKRVMQWAYLSDAVRLDTFIKLTHAASFVDTIWVAEGEEEWQNCNYYENTFNSELGKYDITGDPAYTDRIAAPMTDLTTDGMISKCWVRDDSNIYLLKSSLDNTSIPRANSATNQTSSTEIQRVTEPVAECFAYQVASVLGIPCVEYTLSKLQNTLVSKCPLFTTELTGYLAYKNTTHPVTEEAICKAYEKLNAFKQLSDMVVLDASICNIDRHAGNFGFAVDNPALLPIGPAILFDHGLSFLCTQKPSPDMGCREFTERANRTRSRLFGPFISGAAKYLYPELRERIATLRNFELKQPARYKVLKSDIERCSYLVRHQAHALLGEDYHAD